MLQLRFLARALKGKEGGTEAFGLPFLLLEGMPFQSCPCLDKFEVEMIQILRLSDELLALLSNGRFISTVYLCQHQHQCREYLSQPTCLNSHAMA